MHNCIRKGRLIMRMWMLDAKCLCDKHLIGEHGEYHKFRHVFIKKQSIKGRVMPIVQIEPKEMKNRHDYLAKEMLKRKINHKSPYKMPDIYYLPIEHIEVRANKLYNLIDLSNRCNDCKKRIFDLCKIEHKGFNYE
jgi:hypothetical protein